MNATITKTWFAQYGISGHCSACLKANNDRSTDKNHKVTTLAMEGEEYEICDRHKNLAAAARQAWKRSHNTDCGSVTITNLPSKKTIKAPLGTKLKRLLIEKGGINPEWAKTHLIIIE